MSGDDIGQLTYLVLLGAAIAAYFIADNRQSLGKNLRAAIVWGLLFLGVIAATGCGRVSGRTSCHARR